MTPTNNQKFFDESQEQSEIKAAIVEHYFYAWARIIIATQKRNPHRDQRVGYLDLFAGPGRYKDGAVSTPLRVLKKALSDEDLCERLVTIFNDKDIEHTRSLADAIAELPNIAKLKNQPIVWNEEVGEEIAKQFESINTIPLLAFIDPWGYKGLSLRLVDAFLKDWGCDCIFFFNYARINAGLSNPLVKTHMEALFGEDTSRLSEELRGLKPLDRESTIVEGLAQSLKKFGHRYVLPFCFRNASGKRTTHHLVFVSKSFKGYEVMKEIMAKQSSLQSQGVPSFQFSPPTSSKQNLLLELNRPLDDLKGLLLERFKSRQLTMAEIYKEHCVDTPYIKRNYKAILKKMEDDGMVQTTGRRSKRGFADDITVRFPD